MKYEYVDTKEIKIDSRGSLDIQSSFGDFSESAPISLIENSNIQVNSSFIINGNEIMFNVAGYDKSQTLVIDPWINNPAFATKNENLMM